MGYVIRMPQKGATMEEGTLVEWTTEEGTSVQEGDVIAVVETDKVTDDVEVRESGVIRRLLADPGDVLNPGAPIGILAGPDEDVQPYFEEAANSAYTDAAYAGDEKPASESQPGPDRPMQTAKAESNPHAGGAAVESEPATDADIKAAPGARELANERSVDLSAVEGTGPAGSIVEADVERALETTAKGGEHQTVAPGEAETQTTVTERQPLTGTQKRVAERLQTSFQEAPHVTLHRTYSTDALNKTLAVAERLGVDICINDFLLKVSGEALSEHPEMNAHFDDGEHAIIEEKNVAFAVDTDDGLVTPVVPTVGERSIQSVSATRGKLTERAVEGNLTVSDLQGATFTVTNLGMFGVDRFTPIINPPQVAILGVGRERRDRKMTLSLSFDHRVVNGADAAKFLSTITEMLASTKRLDTFLESSS